MEIKKILAFWMTLCLVVMQQPLTAAGAESASAAVMRMAGTEGKVAVSTENGRNITVKKDMKLYSGYKLTTEQASYAYVSLDGTKAVKMDALSKASIRKSGKVLELLLSSGKLFFNVTAPLEQEETLNVRTSTMVTGIRGTAGVVELLSDQVSTIYLLDGEVEMLARDPVSGEIRSVVIQAGQKATIVTGEDENGQEYTKIFVTELTEEEINGFAAIEVMKDAALQERIRSATGLDVDQIILGAGERLNRDQQEAARLLEESKAKRGGSEDLDSVDPVFGGGSGADSGDTGKSGQTPNHGGSGGTDPTESTPEGTDPPESTPEVTDPTEPTPEVTDPAQPAEPPVIGAGDLSSGNLSGILEAAFASSNEVTLAPESQTGSDEAPAISEDITVPSGKTLNVEDRVSVAPGTVMTVEGTMNIDADFTNNGTVVNKGRNTLVIKAGAYFMNKGVLRNEGRLVNHGEFYALEGETGSELTNKGLIENYGRFEPIVWEVIYGIGSYDDVKIGSFVNEGQVKNYGSVSISYLDGSTPGNPADWQCGGEGLVLLNHQHEYESGYQAQYDSFCDQLLGRDAVRVLKGQDAGMRQVAAARDFQAILKLYPQYENFELMGALTVTGNLMVGETENINLYLNNNILTLEGGSVINKGYLKICGGSYEDGGAGYGAVHGIDTDCVIRNNRYGRLDMKALDVELKSAAGGAESYALENRGQFQIIGDETEQIACGFISHEADSWGFFNHTGEGAVFESGEAEVAAHFEALTEGYTINLKNPDYPEMSNGEGYERDVDLAPRMKLEFNNLLSLEPATPSSASYHLDRQPDESAGAGSGSSTETEEDPFTGAGGGTIAATGSDADRRNSENEKTGRQAAGSLKNVVWKEEEEDEKK